VCSWASPAAELRTDPQRYAGQVASLDAAVHLDTEGRRAAARDPERAPRISWARGPLPERGFVYVVVPEAKRAQLETLTPLATIQVTARVRTGRTRFLGNRCST